MTFFDMIQKLHLIYGLKIMMVSCGSFYISVGADATTLNRELGLKTTCYQRYICKVGVPKNSIEKYIEKLDKLGYGYVIFDYNKEDKTLVKLYEKNGKEVEDDWYRDETVECINCPGRRIFKETEYEEALRKFLKREFGDDYIW